MPDSGAQGSGANTDVDAAGPTVADASPLAQGSTQVGQLADASADTEAVDSKAATTGNRALERLVPDAQFNHFRVLEELGRGGMGVVVSALDEKLERKVAIKVLRSDAWEEQGQERILREAKAMARLSHPNVVSVYEVGESDGLVYIVMELVRGRTLGEWLKVERRTRSEILEVFNSAGRGLAAAHAAGLVHRDFKPDNVIVGSDGRIRVLDLGLASVGSERADSLGEFRSATSGQGLTEDGAVIGTPLYMAPEQHAGSAIDARADQFAFCVALYSALYRSFPFRGKSYQNLADAVQSGALSPLPKKAPVPRRLRRILLRGLSVKPEERFESMEAVLAALQPRYRKRRVLQAASLALGAAAVTGFFVMRSNQVEVAPCPSAEPYLAGVWDEPVASAVGDSFIKTGDPIAATAFAKTSRLLDSYRQSWIAMRHSACEATHVDKTQTQWMLDLRIDCLDSARAELGALSEAFRSADKSTVQRSVRAASELPSIASCADEAALDAPLVPEDEQTRAEAKQIRERLTEPKTLRRLGKAKDALEIALKVAADAEALKYRPLTAEALSLLGDLQDRTGDSKTAVKTLERAVIEAQAGNHRRVVAEANMTLAWVYGYVLNDFDSAHRTVAMGYAAIESLGGNEQLFFEMKNYEGLVLDSEES